MHQIHDRTHPFAANKPQLAALLAPPPQHIETTDLADLLVSFRDGHSPLTEWDVSEIRRWVMSWFRWERPSYILVAPCSAHEPATRERMQAQLSAALIALGVPADQVRHTPDVVGSPPGQTTAAHSLWLKAVDAARANRHGVKPITHLYSHSVHSPEPGMACAS